MSSAAAKAFNSWRAILAPARAAFSSAAFSSTASAPTKKKAKEPRAKPPPMVLRPPPGVYPSLLKPRRVTPALAKFARRSVVSVIEAHAAIGIHIDVHQLRNPQNEREFFCDEKLKTIFNGKDVIKCRKLGKLLSRHFLDFYF